MINVQQEVIQVAPIEINKNECIVDRFFCQDGSTPLHLACLSRQEEIVSLLLKSGAMPDVPNNVI